MTAFTFNFNSRETYLEQVAEWKKTYAAHIQKSRADKLIFKQTQRDFSKAGGDEAPDYRWPDEKKKTYREAHFTMQKALEAVAANVKTAYELILARQASRLEAGRQMLAGRCLA